MKTVLACMVLAVFIGYGTAGRASELKSLCDGIEELFDTPPDSFEDFRGKRWDTASGYLGLGPHITRSIVLGIGTD